MAGQDVRALVVPQFQREHATVPQPAQILPGQGRVLTEPGQRVPAHGNRRGVVAGERDEGVQQQVADHELIVRRTRRGPDGPGHLGDADAFTEPGRELGGGERVQVGLAREPEVQGQETLGRRQQQQRRFVAAAQREGQLSIYQIDLGSLQLIDRSVTRDTKQGTGGVERAGLDAGRGGRQRAPRPRRRHRGQVGGAGQEGSMTS